MRLPGTFIAFRAIQLNRLRSALTILGIAVGIATVIAGRALGSGAQHQVEEQIGLLGTNLLLVTPGSQTSAGVRLGAGSRATLTEDDARALRHELPDVLAAAPNLRGSGPMVYGTKNWLTSFHGSDLDFFVARNWPIVAGRGFTEEELARAAKVVLLGDTVVRNLFGDTDPIGHVVRVRRAPMEVIGVMQPKGPTLQGHDQDDMILVPITTARNRLLGGNQAKLQLIHYISVKVRDGADMQSVQREMRALLRQRHRLQIDAPDDFTIRDLSEVLKAREASTRTMTLLLAVVASISLLLGGVGIMNIMLVSVTERTREIGLRLAVGARSSDIRSQFLTEALVLAIAGGIFGVLAGLGGSYAIAHYGGWRTHVNATVIVLALVSAMAVGILSGLYPAHKAARLSPTAALRHG